MLTTLIGKILKQPFIYTWLWKLARRTPDMHIPSPDGSEIYMYRYWLFNKIDANHKRKYEWIPFSIRIHHIVQPDLDRHLHDHPFNARTWIMRGGYTEVRRELRMQAKRSDVERILHGSVSITTDTIDADHVHLLYHRGPGESTTLGYEQYHKITELDPGGALTFFAFGRYQGAWGFLVDGVKVLHRAYEKTHKLDNAGTHGRFAATADCAAIQRSDQMVCDKCFQSWDVNDQEPPMCGDGTKRARASGGPTLFTSGLQNVDHTNELVRLQNEANMNAWNEAQRQQADVELPADCGGNPDWLGCRAVRLGDGSMVCKVCGISRLKVDEYKQALEDARHIQPTSPWSKGQ